MATERNTELRTAWEFVEHTGRSIFLTGKAGTGKTTFLRTVVERSSKRSIVVAPTGVAAINAGGATIHSFFQLPFAPYVPGTKIKEDFKFSNEKRRIIASLDLLIIDEISMVRADLLDAVDSVLRRYRDWRLPFGGVQLLMIGDLGQLTPVTTPEEEELLRQYYDTPYFFSSQVLSRVDYVTIQLEKVYRQQDGAFLEILNHIRENSTTAGDLGRLNSRYVPDFVPRPEDGYIRLTTHNYQANRYNEQELLKLTGPAFDFQAQVDGEFPDYSYPTNLTLTLKEGAQVMFVKNDPSEDHRYYNGRIGQVVGISRSRVVVHCQNPEEDIEVRPQEWENTRYTLNEKTHEIEPKVMGTFRQLPLRLAWAITIHKSQGLTFEHAIIDAGRSFASGQVYVALSRCKTLEGLVLATPLQEQSIITDNRVNDYIAHQEEAAQRSIGMLREHTEDYYRRLLLELFDFKDLQARHQRLLRLLEEFFARRYNQTTALHRQLVLDIREKILVVADKWTSQLQQMPDEGLHAEALLERVKRSAAYFRNTLEELFDTPLRLAADVNSDNKMAMKRYRECYEDLHQTVRTHLLLLQELSSKTFSVATYLREKNHALLGAMEVKAPKRKRERRKRD